VLKKEEDLRGTVEIVNIEAMVPRDHLLRKIDRAIDFGYIYELSENLYSMDKGRPGVDPVVLFKIVLLQHLYGIPSLRQTIREVEMSIAYRWFLGYNFAKDIPHFATVSYAFATRFSSDIAEKVFRDNSDSSGESQTRTVTGSTTDPDAGLFHKGEHKQCFAYGAHTACDRNNFILEVEVTPGNVHDSVVFDTVYDRLAERFPQMETVVADAGYKTPWICKKVFDDGRIPSLPYKRPQSMKDGHKWYEYVYDEYYDQILCPEYKTLNYATTNRDGYREYKSKAYICQSCPTRHKCTNSKSCVKTVTQHLWHNYLEQAEDVRLSPHGQETYALRCQTIERVFADAKEKHGMRYTNHRGLTRVTSWVRFKFAAMNLKKLAMWKWNGPSFYRLLAFFRFLLAKSELSLA